MAIESKMSRGPIGARPPTPEGKGSKAWVWVVVVILLALGAGAWYWQSQKGTNQEGPIASGEYQAVFLDNGQVYFGKLDDSDDAFFVLTDVFYLQSGVAVTETASLALTKLGAEAHGPEDRMEINVDHVLFVEDMKSDSKVVQAIQQYRSQ
ncbi:hypothetical protein HZA87_03995 [Candidatus Uhrbacteria bacterium]|nr:hypothetical protein [Candidatus Uhrbacteria bacterium]